MPQKTRPDLDGVAQCLGKWRLPRLAGQNTEPPFINIDNKALRPSAAHSRAFHYRKEDIRATTLLRISSTIAGPGASLAVGSKAVCNPSRLKESSLLGRSQHEARDL